ncbi:MAG: DedA family protein [Deltaproteobacteria bacterium]|nr:DedA family protein [Deltaproteobacteria bacterium]
MEAELLQWIQASPNSAYLAVFGVLLACGLGVPMPEDITLIAGGYTVYLAGINKLGSPQLVPMIVVGLVGVLSGDVLLFFAGRWLGPKATRIWPFRRVLSPARVEKARKYFHRYGGWTAFFARFAAGVRAPIYLIAGSMGMRTRTFLLADGFAALISVPLLVWLAWRFGAQIERVKGWLVNSKYALAGVFACLLIYILVKVIRGRRQARLRRAQGQSDAIVPDSSTGAEGGKTAESDPRNAPGGPM